MLKNPSESSDAIPLTRVERDNCIMIKRIKRHSLPTIKKSKNFINLNSELRQIPPCRNCSAVYRNYNIIHTLSLVIFYRGIYFPVRSKSLYFCMSRKCTAGPDTLLCISSSPMNRKGGANFVNSFKRMTFSVTPEENIIKIIQKRDVLCSIRHDTYTRVGWNESIRLKRRQSRMINIRGKYERKKKTIHRTNIINFTSWSF